MKGRSITSNNAIDRKNMVGGLLAIYYVFLVAYFVGAKGLRESSVIETSVLLTIILPYGRIEFIPMPVRLPLAIVLSALTYLGLSLVLGNVLAKLRISAYVCAGVIGAVVHLCVATIPQLVDGKVMPWKQSPSLLSNLAFPTRSIGDMVDLNNAAIDVVFVSSSALYFAAAFALRAAIFRFRFWQRRGYTD